jgi:hypothetical protein
VGGIDRARATDPVTDVALVYLIVRHELGGALDVAIVHLVVEEAVHGHNHGLLHLVRHHDPHHRLHLRRGRRLLETQGTDRVRRPLPEWDLDGGGGSNRAARLNPSGGGEMETRTVRLELVGSDRPYRVCTSLAQSPVPMIQHSLIFCFKKNIHLPLSFLSFPPLPAF